MTLSMRAGAFGGGTRTLLVQPTDTAESQAEQAEAVTHGHGANLIKGPRHEF